MTLTGLIATFYRVLPYVHRELLGLIPAVTWDPQAARAAIGQDVSTPTSPTVTAEDATPGTNPPDSGDLTFGTETMTIQKSRVVPFRWNGEEQRSLQNSVGHMSLNEMAMFEAIRTLTNEMEADLAGLYKRAHIAIGTPGTNPFATSVDIMADLQQLFDDMGVPKSGRQLVIDTTTAAAGLKLDMLQQVNTSGSDSVLRAGELGNLMNFTIRQSSAIKRHTAGTSASHQLNGSHAVGATTLNVDTGTGTILAGDVLSIANGTPTDGYKYVVNSALSAGSLTIGKSGLRSAHADNDAVTVSSSYYALMAFQKSALRLATRIPSIPKEGDQAMDSEILTDPLTGLSFELRVYPQYRRVRYELGAAWGVGNMHPAYSFILQR